MKVEDIVFELNNTMTFHYENCRRFQRHMDFIEQIHQTPSVYMAAAAEVVRRKSFSSAFLTVIHSV